MTRLIGYRWKSREGLSQVVLINLFNFLFSIVLLEQSKRATPVNSEECLTQGVCTYNHRQTSVWSGVFPVLLAIGSHLIPRPRRAGIPNTKFEKIVLGAFSEVGTPVPIPNTEVKHFSADGSRKARVGQCRELFFQM